MSNRHPPVRFTVIGCGMLARAQHIPNLARSPRAVLHSLCDVNADALAECHRQYPAARLTQDFAAAIQDPDVDAVCLATTQRLRLPVIAAAAAAGKPIYVEKPIAPTPEEMYRIRDVVKVAGIPFCVGHNRRASPAMRDAHALFRRHITQPAACPWRFDREGPRRPHLPGDGVAGMSVRINDDWYSWKGWVFEPGEAPDGPMMFEMTHFTDLCNWLLAAEPLEVVALESGVFSHGVVIRYRTGELATITMCANGTFGYAKELYELMGNGGFLAVDHLVELRTAGIAEAPARRVYAMVNDRHPEVGTEGGLSGWLAKKRAACEEAAARGDPSLQFTAEPDKGHAAALEYFIDEICGLGPVFCGVDDAVAATRVALAAIKAARERRVVALAEV